MLTSLAHWQDTGRWFDHHGRRIFWREDGPRDAPVLLLIHGFPTASWDWEGVWPALAQRWRVLALDMLGFGYSDKPRGHKYSIIEQANLQEALLHLENVGEYHILAHDYGDTVAQELLARQAEPAVRPALRSICFLNGGLFPETHRPRLIQRLLLSPLGPLLARRMTRAKFAASFRSIFGPATQPSSAQLDAFWELITRGDGLAAFPRLIRYMPERRRHRARWVGALQRTNVPLKLIDGAIDPVSGSHMAQRYRELVRNADITLLEGIGHYPQIEAPAQMLDAYVAFRAARAS